MEVKGILKQFLPLESGTSKAGKEWQRQSIIIDTEAKYNPLICISFFGDEKIQEVVKFSEGEFIEVGVNLSSKEYQNKWYNQIDGWSIKLQAVDHTEEPKDEIIDDLPF